MITEQYVSFETAKLLKEKGFDILCHGVYRKTLKENEIVDKPNLYIANWFKNNTDLKESEYSDIVYCTAPTQALVMRWLREVHNLFIVVEYNNVLTPTFWFKLNNCPSDILYTTYEEACEEAIKCCLKDLVYYE